MKIVPPEFAKAPIERVHWLEAFLIFGALLLFMYLVFSLSSRK